MLCVTSASDSQGITQVGPTRQIHLLPLLGSLLAALEAAGRPGEVGKPGGGEGRGAA
jgi:hypothetical protein